MRNSLIQLFCEMEEQILEKIDHHLEDYNNREVDRKWIKSSEVCQMLSCSPATLSRYRSEGTLPCSLIQGTYYYKLSDIDQMMEDGKQY